MTAKKKSPSSGHKNIDSESANVNIYLNGPKVGQAPRILMPDTHLTKKYWLLAALDPFNFCYVHGRDMDIKMCRYDS